METARRRARSFLRLPGRTLQCRGVSRKEAAMPNLLLCRKGQGLTEYLILLILIAVVSISAAKSLGTTVREKIQTARQNIDSGITVRSRR